MKVLALVTDAFGGAGGIARYNQDLLFALAENDAIESVRVFPRLGSPANPTSKIHQSVGHGGRVIYSLVALFEVLRFRPDRIFCGHLFMLPLAVFIGRMLKIPVWLQLHGIEAWTKPSGSAVRAVRYVDMVTCVSRYTRRRFLTWANLDPARVKVLPNTVSERFGMIDRDINVSGFVLGKGPVLLTVGRLASTERYKGQDRVLHCLVGLRDAWPDLVYLIAGTGNDEARLRELAQQLGVSESVRFLGDVSADDLPRLYSAADLFVMPSTGEGFGIVYLEAMACGTPALGFDIDGSIDPLRDGELGILANEKNLQQMIDKVLRTQRPQDLAERTQIIFGKQAFVTNVAKFVFEMSLDRDGRTCAV